MMMIKNDDGFSVFYNNIKRKTKKKQMKDDKKMKLWQGKYKQGEVYWWKIINQWRANTPDTCCFA